jgi:predicted permease
LIYRGFEGKVANGPGYRTSHLLLMSFDPSLVGYTPLQTQRFYRDLLDRVRSEGAVKSSALTSVVALSPEQQAQILVPEGYALPPGQSAVTMSSDTVSDRYFETVGINILRGRGFLPSDTADSPLVAVVNQQFADLYWPNEDCIGRRFHLNDSNGPLLQVVGVAQTVKYFWIGEAPTPFVYLPFSQQSRAQMTLAAESAGDASSMTDVLRRTVHDIDPGLPVYNVRTMESFYHQRAVRVPEMVIQTIGCMGIMALILATIGLYGLVVFSVSRRTREIGIRMATGATRWNVLWMVLKQGAKLAASGVVLGLIGSLGADQLIRSIFTFNGVKTSQAMFFLTALMQLLAILLATYVPARRASLLDPVRALRVE